MGVGSDEVGGEGVRENMKNEKCKEIWKLQSHVEHRLRWGWESDVDGGGGSKRRQSIKI